MRMPHVQGAFLKEIVVDTSQAYRLADCVSDGEGSMAEPLAVACAAAGLPRSGTRPCTGRSGGSIAAAR